MLRSLAVALGVTGLVLSPHTWQPRATVKPESVSQLESGVWWVGQPAAAPALPPPAQVPANGLWVSSTTAGTTAMSAVRFSVGAGDRQPILSVPIQTVTTLPGALPIGITVNVLACAATGNWAPPATGSFGALSKAPSFDCGKGQVLGELSPDGKAMVFELSQFLTDTNRAISVVLVPGETSAPIPSAPVALPVAIPNVLIPPTFDVTFKPVTPSAVEVLATPLPAVLGDDEFSVDVNDAAQPDVPQLSPVPAATTQAARKTSRPTGIRAVPGRLAQAATTVAHKGDSPRTRTLMAVIFVDLVLLAWWVNRDALAVTDRPFRTLYDGAGPSTTVRRRLTTTPREGRPPPLR